ncbi:MAG: MFS transporter [Patescibacteria group bacterium]|nr:MFS transporter [Patescibacteria group bacterium]
MRELNKIYTMSFLSGLSSAATVTFTLSFFAHGLNQAQIGILFGFFMVCMAIFNVPTGGIADIFGHKASVAIGLFFQAIAFLLFYLYPNYIGFLLGMFADALGLAFQTGATSSLIYELLHKEGLHEDFQKIIGKAGGYSLIAAIVASPIGSIIYKFYPSIPYLFSFFFFIFAAFTIYFVKWEFVKKQPTISNYVNTLVKGVHLTLRNRILMATVLIGIALSVNRLVFNQNISQPYQLSIGIDVAYIGFTAALVAAVQAFISINAYKISKKVGKSFSLLLIVAVPSVAVIVLSFINTLLAIPLILVLYMGHAFRDPVLAHISQEEVDSDKRSTMASTISFLVTVLAGVLLPFWGKGVDLFGIHNSLFLLGAFSFILGVTGLLMFETKRKV